MALAACTNLNSGPLQNIASATDTLPPATATFQWFPPTVTPTRAAVRVSEPTPDRKPGVGNLILTDDFSSAAEWNTAASGLAGADVDRNRLTIAIQPGVAAVASLRKGPVFDDLYVEITARPSLCRGADEYGLLFRAPNNVAYYRFVLQCNGTVSADRVSLGKPRVLQPPIHSGDVPVGVPAEVRLGVWAVGSEFRFFLNGRYQFSANDKNYAAGTIGVYAHAAGLTAVTVTFSDLSVYAVTP